MYPWVITSFCVVRHRIDGLETLLLIKFMTMQVRHRIDGLEMLTMRLNIKTKVRHRIDGLERRSRHCVNC